MSADNQGADYMDKALKLIEQYDMLANCGNVVVGLSGGADSVSLLRLICSLKEKYNINPVAVHVNHGIRGAEADRDEAFAKELCKAQGITCFVSRADVPAYALKNGLSEEEAGRRLRYEAFAAALEKFPGVLALAHNSDDQAETIIFNLIRGSYFSGLAGMKPVTQHNAGGITFKVIRPLLTTSRREIEEYLRKSGQQYVNDGTNFEDIYSRNIIRHKLLPVMEEISQGAREHIIRLGSECEEISEFTRRAAGKLYKKALADHGTSLNTDLLRDEEEFIKRQVMYRFITENSGSARDITKIHVTDAVKLISAEGGKYIMLPYGLILRKVYNYIRAEKSDAQNKPELQPFFDIGIIIRQTGSEPVCFGAQDDRCHSLVYDKIFYLSEDFKADYDKLKVRYVKEDDYIILFKEGGRKKIKKLLKDARTEPRYFDNTLVLAEGNRCIAVIAVKDGAPYVRIDESVKDINNKNKELEIIIKA